MWGNSFRNSCHCAFHNDLQWTWLLCLGFLICLNLVSNIIVSKRLICSLVHRIVASRSRAVRFSTTKDCHIVRRIITQNVDRCAPAARNRSPADASRPCLRSSIRSTLCAHSAWSSWTRERSRSKTTSHTVTVALTSCSARQLDYTTSAKHQSPTSISYTVQPFANYMDKWNRTIFRADRGYIPAFNPYTQNDNNQLYISTKLITNLSI